MINQSSMKPNSQWEEGVYISEYKARILPFIDDTIGRIIAKPITPQEGVEIAAKLKEYCQAHAKEQLEKFAEELKTILVEQSRVEIDTLLRKHTGEEK